MCIVRAVGGPIRPLGIAAGREAVIPRKMITPALMNEYRGRMIVMNHVGGAIIMDGVAEAAEVEQKEETVGKKEKRTRKKKEDKQEAGEQKEDEQKEDEQKEDGEQEDPQADDDLGL